MLPSSSPSRRKQTWGWEHITAPPKFARAGFFFSPNLLQFSPHSVDPATWVFWGWERGAHAGPTGQGLVAAAQDCAPDSFCSCWASSRPSGKRCSQGMSLFAGSRWICQIFSRWSEKPGNLGGNLAAREKQGLLAVGKQSGLAGGSGCSQPPLGLLG